MLTAVRNWLRRRRWNKLVASVRDYEMTPEEREEQRRSFAYGNVKLSNPEVTREMVDVVANREQGLCPDSGTCHHGCEGGPCARVQIAGPLSGVFPNDEWPEFVKAAHRESLPEPSPEALDRLRRLMQGKLTQEEKDQLDHFGCGLAGSGGPCGPDCPFAEDEETSD